MGGKSPEIYRQMLAQFERASSARSEGAPRRTRMVELNVAYAADRDEAIEAQRKFWAGAFVPALYDQKIYTPRMSEQNGEVVGPDSITKMACISNDPDEQVEFAQRYVELGFDHLIMHSAGPDQRAFIEGYGRDVLPRLRSVVAARASRLATREWDGRRLVSQGLDLGSPKPTWIPEEVGRCSFF